MNIIHTGLPASSEINADNFFAGILGLEKSASKILNKNLSDKIFGINKDLSILNYRNENTHFEIIIYPEYKALEKKIVHCCIKVEDLKNFINKCRSAGLKIIEIPKDTGDILIFISDYDGNLFEVKG